MSSYRESVAWTGVIMDYSIIIIDSRKPAHYFLISSIPTPSSIYKFHQNHPVAVS